MIFIPGMWEKSAWWREEPALGDVRAFWEVGERDEVEAWLQSQVDMTGLTVAGDSTGVAMG